MVTNDRVIMHLNCRQESFINAYHISDRFPTDGQVEVAKDGVDVATDRQRCRIFCTASFSVREL